MKTQSAVENLALFNTLREVLKTRRYTYARLAKEIGVSEVTIKRVFSTRTCSVKMLWKICDQIGVSLLDVATLARSEEEKNYFLTREQETYFSEKPAHFAIFKELIQGASLVDIEREWEISSGRTFKIARSLERLKLLEVLPQGRIRVNIEGNIRMSHRGPLARKVLRPHTQKFLNHIDAVLENDDVCMQSIETELSDTHVTEFVEEIHALGSKYRARALRDRTLLPREKLRSVRWLFGFAPYKTDWREFKP